VNLDAGLDIGGGESLEEMRELAGAKPDQAECRVLDARRCEPAVLAERGDRRT